MTTTAQHLSTVPVSARPRGRLRRWGGAIAFEWTKLIGVRSTAVALVIGAIVMAGIGPLLGASAKASEENGFDAAAPSPFLAFQALQVAQFLVVVVATLLITGEYSSGSIKTTLQSVPVRGRVLAAKMVVLAITGFVAGVILTMLGTLATAPFAAEYGTYTGGQFFGAAVAAGIYFAALSVVTVGLGAALRSAAGTITTILVLVFALPQVLPIFRVEWLKDLADYLPSNAAAVLGLQLTEPYGSWTAVLVLALWAAAAAIAGYATLRARDA